MSQFDFGTINPDTKDGTTLASDLGSWRDALNTVHGGATRPAYVQAGMLWRKEVSGTLWELTLYDGTADVVIATINPSTGVFSLPNDSVGNAAMQANAVNTGNIVNLAITAEKLANLAITAAKIVDGAIIRSKIDASAFASGAEIRAAQEGAAIVSPADLAIAHGAVSLVSSASLAWDMRAGINFVVGQSSNFTVQFPSNPVVGRAGLLQFWPAAGGPHTISWAAGFVSSSASFPDELSSNMVVPFYCENVSTILVP